MPADKQIEVKGLDTFIEALEKFPEQAEPIAVEAMTNSEVVLIDDLKNYAPATEANQPGRFSRKTGRPMGYYERGKGWWYPVMREKTLGTKLGKRVGAIKTPKRLKVMMPGIVGYKLRKTSQRLGTRWKGNVVTGPGWIYGEVGTTVSYADYVQGDKQARMHAARGWKNTQQILDDDSDEIVQFFEDAVEKMGALLTK
jgi:hypothetical protein